MSDLRSRLGRFAEVFKVNIADIQTGQLQDWLDGLKLVPQSYINYRRVVFSLFAFAEARGYIFKGTNPVESVESVEAGGGKTEVYTPTEIQRLLFAAAPSLPAIAVEHLPGCVVARLSGLNGVTLIWQADKSRKRLRRKTASRRVVPPLIISPRGFLPTLAEKGCCGPVAMMSFTRRNKQRRQKR